MSRFELRRNKRGDSAGSINISHFACYSCGLWNYLDIGASRLPFSQAPES